MSQSPTDSLATIEDNTLYEAVYREGVSREEVYREVYREEMQSQLADPHSGVLPHPGPVSQGGGHLGRERVHFEDSDSDDLRPSVRRKVSRTEESSALLTATKKMQDLEARVEALEEGKVKCVKVVQEWAKMNEKFMQDLTALIAS
ncbi:hypothetical protein PMIN01_11941 [Paraphaeosphaeria minitans]|uniref:Uncharacterized protein n=1 Tax=Paraphaeosphaeria minitans TaxID=565426 RepID=A0A9P6G789_9PLEO|nr:hypothetical protein PMIN01_13554 [Paraphaeosphaeria minitans]KAF9730008.1 hypothetical protein PMIN01_11941 [Paraphaeosphaeria minitans]